jgi:probable HAF family extracellular repeat protein
VDYTTGEFALADTVTGEVASKGILGEPQRNVPTALSPALHVTALHGEPVQAGLWSDAAGWQDPGGLFAEGCIKDPGPPVLGDLSSAWDVIDDGHVVVGLAWNGCATVQAFRWTDASGAGVITGLGVLGKILEGGAPRPPMNRATVVSGDGRIAAGFAENGAADRSPAIWNEDGTGFLLEPANENEPGKVINSDGTLVAGYWSGKGFVWTEADGVTRFAASASELDTVVVNTMTADGARLFGAVLAFDPDLLQTTQKAFVWSAKAGVHPLAEIAGAAGVKLPADATLTNVLGVSTDGGVVLPTLALSNPDPLGWPIQKSFVMRVPPLAYEH